MNVYPNPFSSEIYLSYFLDNSSDISVSLYDINGKRIDLLDEQQAAGQYSFNLDMEKYHLRPGLYLLRFYSIDEAVVRQMEKM